MASQGKSLAGGRSDSLVVIPGKGGEGWGDGKALGNASLGDS